LSLEYFYVVPYALSLVRLPAVFLALESRESGLLALLNAAKEVQVRIVQIAESGLQCYGIYFSKPYELVFKRRESGTASVEIEGSLFFLVQLDALGKEVVIRESAAPESTLDQFFLHFIGI